MAGFNVVDTHALNQRLGVPVLVVSRHRPDMAAVHDALLGSVRGGKRKWHLVEQAGPPMKVSDVWIQCAGCTSGIADLPIKRLAVNGHIPEPLRTAHLIAGGFRNIRRGSGYEAAPGQPSRPRRRRSRSASATAPGPPGYP